MRRENDHELWVDKALQVRGYDLCEGSIFAWRDWGKPQITLARTVSSLAKVWTRYLQNTIPECYCYINLLSTLLLLLLLLLILLLLLPLLLKLLLALESFFNSCIFQNMIIYRCKLLTWMNATMSPTMPTMCSLSTNHICTCSAQPVVYHMSWLPSYPQAANKTKCQYSEPLEMYPSGTLSEVQVTHCTWF